MAEAAASVAGRRGKGWISGGEAVRGKARGPQLGIYEVEAPATVRGGLEVKLRVVAEPCRHSEGSRLQGDEVLVVEQARRQAGVKRGE